MTKHVAMALVPDRVSLVVPCYNVEAYLEDFVSSIEQQTYKDMEVILVNDGANAATTQGLREAADRFRAQGYLVKLIEQENRGLGGAVDAGLKHFTGEFLMWPDPDDWLTPVSVARRVTLMSANPDVGLLRTNAQLWIEARQTFDGHFMDVSTPAHLAHDLFEDLLFLRFFYAPVCHMVRSAMFLEVFPDRTIYFGPESSQNFQLLVPFVERFPVLEMPNEVLAGYRVREDSRSRAPNKSREKLMKRFDQLYDLAQRTMAGLQTATPERLDLLDNFHWRNRMFPTAFRATMSDRCRTLVQQSAMPAGRKSVLKGLITITGLQGFQALDSKTGRVASRAMARLADRLVMLPKAKLSWGTPPLWSRTTAQISVPEAITPEKSRTTESQS